MRVRALKTTTGGMARISTASLIFTTLLLVSGVAQAAVFHVGRHMQYERPSDVAAIARDGDTIEIEAGDYYGDVAIWHQDDLTIRGIGGRPRLIADGKAAEAKGIWVIKGDNAVVENIEFSGAKVEDRNGAGIRMEGTGLTVRNCYFHHNENGILTDADPDADILIEHSEFAYNGYGDGYSHNMYISRVKSFTLRYSYVHHANVGHQVKSRAESNTITFNRLMDERSGNSSYLIDLPNDGNAYIVGNVMQQGEVAENWGMINSAQTSIVLHNTIVNDRGSGVFIKLSGDTGASLVQNNLFVGTGVLDVGDAEQYSNLKVAMADAGLVNDWRFDYRLRQSSPAIDKGAPIPATHAAVALPESEYAHTAGKSLRKMDGSPDLGAHEFRQEGSERM